MAAFAFAPANLALDAVAAIAAIAAKPHHEPPPRPLQVQHGPFAHQLNPSPSPSPSPQPHAPTPSSSPSPSPSAQPHARPSSRALVLGHHLSSAAMAGANAHAPMAVPGGRINGHDHRANLRDMGFAGPRSPPNNKSRLPPLPPPLPSLAPLY